MKKSISLFIFFLLVFQSTSGLYIITAFYINQNYIAKNVCINRFDSLPVCKGKCYLAKELKANDKEQQKYPTVNYKEIQLFCENAMVLSFPETTVSVKKSYPILRKNEQKSIFVFSIYHPPKSA